MYTASPTAFGSASAVASLPLGASSCATAVSAGPCAATPVDQSRISPANATPLASGSSPRFAVSASGIASRPRYHRTAQDGGSVQNTVAEQAAQRRAREAGEPAAASRLPAAVAPAAHLPQ